MACASLVGVRTIGCGPDPVVYTTLLGARLPQRVLVGRVVTVDSNNRIIFIFYIFKF